MTYEDFSKLCHERRSIRYFGKQPISRDDILSLLELARQAPSVENTQPWHFHVILDKKMRTKLLEASCYGNFVEGAGAFIIVTCDMSLQRKVAEPVWNPRELEYSCMSAMEHVLLGATAKGLGSCWVSLHHGAVHELLGLAIDQQVVGGIMIGHYLPGEEAASNGRQRKPLNEICTFHG